jgi:hypothetical protein
VVDASARGWLVVISIGGMLTVIPAIAWVTWLRRPRPRALSLLVVALATSAPLAAGLAGTIWSVMLIRSFERNEATEPSEKALLLAESISTVMNGTAFAVVGALVVSGITVAASRWRNRRPR